MEKPPRCYQHQSDNEPYHENDMGKYKKEPDVRHAPPVMIGHKPGNRANNVFLFAKTKKELKQKIIDAKIKSNEMVKESDAL